MAAGNDDDPPPAGLVKIKGAPRGNPDSDARWGRKSRSHSFHGYKHYISVDARVLTPGKDNDGEQMEVVFDELVAEKAYGYAARPRTGT